MELHNLTVMFCDKNVIVDSVLIKMPVTPPTPDVRCIQWQKTWGWVEYEPLSGKPNLELAGDADYATWVAPYIALWGDEQARILAEQQKEKDSYNSAEARGDRLRRKRDQLIAKTDFLVASDYPLTKAARTPWLEYRQALRDFTKADGYPWREEQYGYPWAIEGDDCRAPWPTPPASPVIRGINDFKE